MSEDRWTPMLHTRYRFAMWRRRRAATAWRFRHWVCRHTRGHASDGLCARCRTVTITIVPSIPKEWR